MRRTELREHIFKLLFMTEFHTPEDIPEKLQLYFGGIEEEAHEKNEEEVTGTDPDWQDGSVHTGGKGLPLLSSEDRKYMEKRYNDIKEKIPDIDGMLNEQSKGWKVSRMNRVDLSVLRLAVYELCFDEEIPVGVAINEAVTLAKRFGGEESGAFVNGILGKIAKALPPKRNSPDHE